MFFFSHSPCNFVVLPEGGKMYVCGSVCMRFFPCMCDCSLSVFFFFFYFLEYVIMLSNHVLQTVVSFRVFLSKGFYCVALCGRVCFLVRVLFFSEISNRNDFRGGLCLLLKMFI
uniref:(northern house mosquito) hypothetical protein n=1 Tax=Culex pipiens TaxID=7175 RepID=A0A8D8FMU8_CULPI